MMLDFEITSDGVLTRYNSRNPDVVIPDRLIHIGAHAFANCEFIRSVTFPDSVIHIRKSAFQNCRNLEQVILPDYLVDIGEGAFCQCKSLKDVRFPRRLEKIGRDAFLGCVRLEQAVLPDSVAEIGQGAFQGCEKLKSVRLPKSLTELKDYLFSYCTALSELEIPETVTKIGAQTFYDCQNISELHLPDGLEFISSDALDSGHLCKLTYKGIHFTNRGNASLCVYVISNHKFRVTLPTVEKVSILIQMYHQNPEDNDLILYLKEQFSEIIHPLIDENQAGLIRDVIQAGQMIQKENID
ncbi:MAG: leucine-rich repeat domain-containing protein, partial [Oscillospiraceae bacterium]|nr:leucine-rich repeat domain-containing protein [Oscillospiraceae bacterium]